MEKVSIIIPVYNSEKTLKKCIESVIKQTYKNTEILIINDGSTDKSLEIMEKYQKKDDRIIVISQENKGLSGARNTGIKQSTGSYITFLDSDDYIENNMIEESIEKFTKYDCEIVRNNYVYDYFDGSIMQNSDTIKEDTYINLKNEEEKEKFIKEILLGKIQSYSCLLMIKKKAFKEKELLFDEEILFMEDMIFLNQILLKTNKIFLISKPMYHYYQNQNGMSQNYNNYTKNMQNILIMNRKLQEILILHGTDSKNYIKISNTIYINGIIGYLRVAVIKGKEYVEILNELKEIREKNIMQEMIKNKEYRILKVHCRLYVFLYKMKLYNLLVLMFKIEKKLKGCKKNYES